MKMQSRLLDGAMAAAAVVLLVLLVYPARPAPLPARTAAGGVPQPAQLPVSRGTVGARPSAAEVAGLFAAARPASAPAPAAPASSPERVPWLHYIAYVVGSSGQTTWFFKNDQTGRVLMLVLQQPRDGWTLAAIQGDAWLLESQGHRYLVSRK